MSNLRRTENFQVPTDSVAVWPRWLVLGSILFAIGLAYGLSQNFRTLIHEVTYPMAMGDFSALKDFILSFGWWAPVISFLLMILQTLIAPLPAFVLAMANSMAFGMVYGFLLTCSSAVIAAFTAFGLSRWLGRPFLKRRFGGNTLGKIDAVMEMYGAWAVLVLRLFPVISYDAVSFAAGLTVMRMGPFGLATFVGMLPATIAFALLGDSLESANRWSFIGGVALLGILLIAAACMRWSAFWRSARPAREPSGRGEKSPVHGELLIKRQ